MSNWFDDSVTILWLTLLDIIRIYQRYPVIFITFSLFVVTGIILYIVRWFYRANDI